jgi:hypothetical protein
MKKEMLKQVLNSFATAREEFKNLTKSQRNQIEKSWDVEHAYYSSTLEGSKIDKKEFEKLGAKVA